MFFAIVMAIGLVVVMLASLEENYKKKVQQEKEQKEREHMHLPPVPPVRKPVVRDPGEAVRIKHPHYEDDPDYECSRCGARFGEPYDYCPRCDRKFTEQTVDYEEYEDEEEDDEAMFEEEDE